MILGWFLHILWSKNRMMIPMASHTFRIPGCLKLPTSPLRLKRCVFRAGPSDNLAGGLWTLVSFRHRPLEWTLVILGCWVWYGHHLTALKICLNRVNYGRWNVNWCKLCWNDESWIVNSVNSAVLILRHGPKFSSKLAAGQWYKGLQRATTADPLGTMKENKGPCYGIL